MLVVKEESGTKQERSVKRQKVGDEDEFDRQSFFKLTFAAHFQVSSSTSFFLDSIEF